MPTIVGLSGSLRKDSLNTRLLHAAGALLPDNHEFLVGNIDLPLYNADLDPASVPSIVTLRAQIYTAAGVLIATPEYNYGIPGGLKNALDWMSRPSYNSVFAGKKVAIMGASMSGVGTARAQAHLKQVLSGMVAHVVPHPEFLLGAAHQKFDGDALEETSTKFLAALVDKFVAAL